MKFNRAWNTTCLVIWFLISLFFRGKLFFASYAKACEGRVQAKTIYNRNFRASGKLEYGPYGKGLALQNESSARAQLQWLCNIDSVLPNYPKLREASRRSGVTTFRNLTYISLLYQPAGQRRSRYSSYSFSLPACTAAVPAWLPARLCAARVGAARPLTFCIRLQERNAALVTGNRAFSPSRNLNRGKRRERETDMQTVTDSRRTCRGFVLVLKHQVSRVLQRFRYINANALSQYIFMPSIVSLDDRTYLMLKYFDTFRLVEIDDRA